MRWSHFHHILNCFIYQATVDLNSWSLCWVPLGRFPFSYAFSIFISLLLWHFQASFFTELLTASNPSSMWTHISPTISWFCLIHSTVSQFKIPQTFDSHTENFFLSVSLLATSYSLLLLPLFQFCQAFFLTLMALSTKLFHRPVTLGINGTWRHPWI